MAPWGYCITVDLASESDDETVYVCHREGCNEAFHFPRGTTEEQMRAVIYPHLDEKH